MQLSPFEKDLLIRIRNHGLALRTIDEGAFPLSERDRRVAYDMHKVKLLFITRVYAWITIEGIKWLSAHE